MPPDLIAELRSLTDRELRLTLEQLEPDERARVLALIEQRDDVTVEPSFDTLAALSPWLLRAIDEAGSSGPSDGARQTPAARAALLAALDQVATANGKQGARPKPTSKTFIGRLAARASARPAA